MQVTLIKGLVELSQKRVLLRGTERGILFIYFGNKQKLKSLGSVLSSPPGVLLQ
jgi:hypothetical protein